MVGDDVDKNAPDDDDNEDDVESEDGKRSRHECRQPVSSTDDAEDGDKAGQASASDHTQRISSRWSVTDPAEEEDEDKGKGISPAPRASSSVHDAKERGGSKRVASWNLSDQDLLRDLNSHIEAVGGEVFTPDAQLDLGGLRAGGLGQGQGGGAGGTAKRARRHTPGRRVWWPDQQEEDPEGGFMVKTSKKVT
jgi:hypothetical protein